MAGKCRSFYLGLTALKLARVEEPVETPLAPAMLKYTP